MRKLLFSVLILISIFSFSQAPEAINYQGIARDALGNIVTTTVGVKFEIHQGSAVGPVIYDETHTIIPASSGVFTAPIGRGVPGIGTFSTSINWGTNKYFLSVNIDPAGGTSYSAVGTSELLSVPYALYAKTSGNASITYTAGTGINISGGVITNTSPNQTVNISGGGGTTVSGTYPNYIISSTTSTSAATSSLQVNTPHSVTTLGPNNFSLNIQPTNISGPGVLGSYPNYTLAASPSTTITSGSTNLSISGSAPSYTISSIPPIISGTGVTNVSSSFNSYTVSTPPVNMTFLPGTGMLTYSPAIGPNTVNISPAITFTNNVLTVGSNSVSVPVTGIWTRPSSSVTTLTNVNDNVGIGISTPNNRLHVVEAVNGIAAVKAINTYTTASTGSAMGLWAEANNPNGSSAAVYGVHNGGGNGVSGISNANTYTGTAGVYGYAAGTSSTNVSVQADVNNGNSIGVYVNSFPSHTGTGLYSFKAGSAGNAAKIEIANTTNSADALLATTNGLGAAIHAVNGPTVTGSSNVLMLLENGHIKTIQSTKPTIVTSTGLGAGSSCSINGNGTDIAGEILLNTGTLATGPPYYLVLVTFNKPLSSSGSAVIILTARSPQTAALQLFAVPNGNTGFWVGTNNTPGSSTNYQLFYYVIER